jgi:serine/threonine-protein kinase
VLELVEGETLAEILQRGPLPVEEALSIAHQICEALEAAHEKGVIHRDLKPANVKVTRDGKVKVLDFGLAKALDNTPASGNLTYSPTLTLAATQSGVVMGTAAYMSPEQAKGFNTDQRSDIFAFGCVLYEMLTGKATFDGDSVSDVLASVLKSEPELHRLPENLNPLLRDLLKRCLEKNPRRRWYAIGDVRMEIEAIRTNPSATSALQPITTTETRPSWKRVVPVLLATLLLGVAMGIGSSYFKSSKPVEVTRFQIDLPQGHQFTNTGRNVLALSRDGTQIVYVANQSLYHRYMNEFESRMIPGTNNLGSILDPVFSPDGKSIVFYTTSDNTFKKIAVTGGAAVTLCAADAPFGVNWGDDGIVFGQSLGGGAKGILRVLEKGGKPDVLVTPKDGESLYGPELLPGGKAVLYSVVKGNAFDAWDRAQIVVEILKTHERKLVLEGGSEPRYLRTGHIVYAFAGSLFAIPFDVEGLRVTGVQVPVVEGVRRAGNTTQGIGTAHYTFSDNGSLIYAPGPASGGGGNLVLAMLDRKGGSLELRKVTPRPYGMPRVSPNGKQVAVGVDDGKQANVWIYDLSGNTEARQLTSGGANRYPIWSPDSQRVIFQSDREGDLGLFWQKADGSGQAERLTKPEMGVAHIPDSPSPNQMFSFTSSKSAGESSVWIYSLADKKEKVFHQVPSANARWSAFSPKGDWLVYQTNETGKNQVWLQPYPATGAKYLIVNGGQPFWSPSGNEIFFNSGPGQISAVSLITKPTVRLNAPFLVTSVLQNRGPNASPRATDITPDGKFIGVANPDAASVGFKEQILVVLNWFSEVKERAGVK